MGASRVPGTVALTVLSLAFVGWLLGLATSEPQYEGRDGNLIVCRSVSDASDLTESEPGGTAALGCERLRDRRLWWIVLVAIPTTVALTATVRLAVRLATDRTARGGGPRRNEEPQV